MPNSFATPWTVARQAPLSMEFSRQEYWNGLPFPSSINTSGTIQLHYFLEQLFHLSESEVAQSCLTLCDPIDGSLRSSSVHGIFQARILEWIAISFSRESSQPRDQTWVSCIAGKENCISACKKKEKRT